MFKAVFITQAKTQYIQRSKSRQMDNYDESIQKLPTNNKGATTEARSNMEESHRYVEWKKPNTYTAWFPNLQWQEAGSGDLEQEWRKGEIPKIEEETFGVTEMFYVLAVVLVTPLICMSIYCM